MFLSKYAYQGHRSNLEFQENGTVLKIDLYELFSALSSKMYNSLFKLQFLFYFSLILIIVHTKLVLSELRYLRKYVRLMNGLLVNNCTCYYLINVALKQRLLLIYVLLQYAVYHLQAKSLSQRVHHYLAFLFYVSFYNVT